MRKIVMSNDLGPAVLRALGVDADSVVEFTLTCRAGEPVCMDITRHVLTEVDVTGITDRARRVEFKALTDTLASYHLTPRESS